MRPSQLARLAEVSTDTLRLYEARGLLPKARRSPNGYREYAPEACARVRLVRRAVALGFTLDELRRILATRDRGGAPCREVRALAARKLALVDARLVELTQARERLRAVLERWDGLLHEAPEGKRVELLAALEDLVECGSPSPFLPPALRRKARARG